MKTCTEEMRQFTVVCRVAIQLGWKTYGTKCKQPNLSAIGLNDFGLTPYQVCSCIGQAREYLDEVTRLDRIRKGGRVNFNTSVGQKLAA